MANVKKDKALEALLSANTLTEAAEIAGISRKTLYSYIHSDPAFLLKYRDCKRELLRKISDKISDSALQAIDTILDIMNDSESPQRLQSAVKFLELFVKFRLIEGALNKDLLVELDAETEKSMLDLILEKQYPDSL